LQFEDRALPDHAVHPGGVFHVATQDPRTSYELVHQFVRDRRHVRVFLCGLRYFGRRDLFGAKRAYLVEGTLEAYYVDVIESPADREVTELAWQDMTPRQRYPRDRVLAGSRRYR
jgi:hypothetical protein